MIITDPTKPEIIIDLNITDPTIEDEPYVKSSFWDIFRNKNSM